MMLYFVLTTFLAGIILADVPSYIHVCGRRNPHLDDCILRSVDSLRTKLRKGIPELDVLSVEPLILDEIELSNDPSFKAIAQHVKLFGFTDFELKTLRVDLTNKRFDIDATFKKIRLDAEGDLTARVLVPIAGKGPINIIAENVAAKVALMFQLVDHEDAKYLSFSSTTTKLHIQNYTSQFMSRKGSDGILAEGINVVLCENQQEVIETITPKLEKDISERIRQLANSICKNFTYDELLPDRE